MAYLWRGWPERVKAGRARRVRRMFAGPMKTGNCFAEGFQEHARPACNASGEVFFADTSNNKITALISMEKLRDFVADSGAATASPSVRMAGFTPSQKRAASS